MIDDRLGDSKGAILEHPVFHEVSMNPDQIPRVTDLASIDESGEFRDPIASLDEGKKYRGNWIAAARPVLTDSDYTSCGKASEKIPNKFESNLFVLVAENYDSVITPVAKLSNSLFWLAVYATVFFVFVALAMWILVIRMLRESNSPLARNFAAAGDSTYRSGVSDTSGK